MLYEVEAGSFSSLFFIAIITVFYYYYFYTCNCGLISNDIAQVRWIPYERDAEYC